MLLPKLSLVLNLIVLIPVCSGLLLNSAWVAGSYGPASAARGILLSIYLTILLASLLLLFKFDSSFVIALLSLQVVYKILSPFMVGRVSHPVIISNLLIALFHACSIGTMVGPTT
jgi:hypothetical protein